MELVGKQRRLLNDLEDIDMYGGHLGAHLEQGSEDFFRLEGWKGTQDGGRKDLNYTIGAADLYQLQKCGCIVMDPDPMKDKYNLQITPKGLTTLHEQPCKSSADTDDV